MRSSDSTYVRDAADTAARVDSFSTGFGSEIESIISTLKASKIDLASDRGRELVWKAWWTFLGAASDWERYAECDGCSKRFRAKIDRRFVDTLIGILARLAVGE
jgi:hypothetical protein